MRTIRLKVAELFEFQGRPRSSEAPDFATITALVAEQFRFLPQPTIAQVEGDEVVIQFPEESTAAQAEAYKNGDAGN